MATKLIIGNNEVEVEDTNQVSDGYHTFGQLYDHRVTLMGALMSVVHGQPGFDVGWSLRHDDGELCFGGGWLIAWIHLPNGKQIRYHMADSVPLPKMLEKEVGSEWNGVEETLEGLKELMDMFSQ
jgi:hypothetical protein